MEYIGVVAFCLVLTYIGLPEKVKKLKKKIDKMELVINGGVSEMSKLLKELEGKQCKIILEGDFSANVVCEILEMDEEWVKVLETKKKGEKIVRIIRIESIKEITEVV